MIYVINICVSCIENLVLVHSIVSARDRRICVICLVVYCIVVIRVITFSSIFGAVTFLVSSVVFLLYDVGI